MNLPRQLSIPLVPLVDITAAQQAEFQEELNLQLRENLRYAALLEQKSGGLK